MTHDPVAPSVFLVAVSGPDQGKRLALLDRAHLIGRAADCQLRSDDPAVAPRHVALVLREGSARFLALEPATTSVNGVPKNQGTLGPGEQLRVGNSLWQVEGRVRPSGEVSFLESLGEKISTAAGVEKIQGWSAQTMFSEVFKHRTEEEIEEYFAVGTPATTPPLLEVPTDWPKPWAFFRALGLSLAVYLGFVFAWNEFQNAYLLPGLMMVGSIAVPCSILVFFFEMNVLRNVSLYQLIRLVMLGGLLSIVISLFEFQWTALENWLGAMSAGLIEEPAKLLAVVLMARDGRYRWTLNGLLLGAAVGTGFAVFESAGYAFYHGLVEQGTAGMMNVIFTRGVLSVLGGHALFTGLAGAALWRVRAGRPVTREMLLDRRFVRVFALCVVLHMVWNSPIDLPFFAKYLVVGFVAWVALLSFIQDGLRQVRREQVIVMPTLAG
ncbi:MAG TPA: PrsW family glutamic-type intramembrane protease [Gemmatimonadales bacterium]|nr:PrsW family glutamic-type intramembrane protease [Gemmatimonadales bacterium]